MFEWLGSTTTDAIKFEIIDVATFEVLHSGNTTLGIIAVPEPSTIVLFLFSLLLITRSKTTQIKGEATCLKTSD